MTELHRERSIEIILNVNENVLVPETGWEGADPDASVSEYIEQVSADVDGEFYNYIVRVIETTAGNLCEANVVTYDAAEAVYVKSRVREIASNVWADGEWLVYTDIRDRRYWYIEGARHSYHDDAESAWIDALQEERIEWAWSQLKIDEKLFFAEAFRFGYEDTNNA